MDDLREARIETKDGVLYECDCKYCKFLKEKKVKNEKERI